MICWRKFERDRNFSQKVWKSLIRFQFQRDVCENGAQRQPLFAGKCAITSWAFGTNKLTICPSSVRRRRRGKPRTTVIQYIYLRQSINQKGTHFASASWIKFIAAFNLVVFSYRVLVEQPLHGMQIASQFRIRLPLQVQVYGSREDWTEAHGIAFQLKIEIGKNKNTIHYKLLKVLPFR